MIVQIVGTSGSGKSYAMLELMRLGEAEAIRVPEHDVILGYDLALPDVVRTVHVVGRYDVPSGGCDATSNVTENFRRVRAASAGGKHVLFEGLFVMNQTRGPELAREVGPELQVFLLTTPLALCYAAIDERRSVRGVGRLMTRHNTENNFTRSRNYTARMREAGARVHRMSRELIVQGILDVLEHAV